MVFAAARIIFMAFMCGLGWLLSFPVDWMFGAAASSWFFSLWASFWVALTALGFVVGKQHPIFRALS
jgi:hypothetical protein